MSINELGGRLGNATHDSSSGTMHDQLNSEIHRATDISDQKSYHGSERYGSAGGLSLSASITTQVDADASDWQLKNPLENIT